MEQGLKDMATVLAAAVGLATLIFGVFQYTKAQRWKRAEFVAGEMTAFFADRTVRQALLMLDWNARPIDLHGDSKHPPVVVTDAMVERALMPHADRPEGFASDEVAIRDIFDYFFDRLTRFNAFIDSGLVTAGEFRVYLKYYLGILSDGSQQKSRAYVRRLRTYLECYGYDGADQFLMRCGVLWPQEEMDVVAKQGSPPAESSPRSG